MIDPELAALIKEVSTWILPVLLAVTLHEAAHGYAAWWCGDDTALRMGRISFNPLRHVDPFGTVILPAMMLMAGGFLFGYAKPVPINPRRFLHQRRDTAIVALAGPGTNIALAILAALLLRLLVALPFDGGLAVAWAGENLANAVSLNVMLALFNMLPLLPLDGGRVLGAILPPGPAQAFQRSERYGLLILLGLLFILPVVGEKIGINLNILGWILWPAYSYVHGGIMALAGLGGAG